MTSELRTMYSDFVRDAMTEAAIEAAARLATHLGDGPEAVKAWSVAHALKALRRDEVRERLEQKRIGAFTKTA